jgi:hypothetical protein
MAEAEHSSQVKTFLDAVKERYGAEDTTEYDASAFSVGVEKKGRKNKQWEMVGMEKTRQKQSQWHKVFSLVLAGAGIHRAEAVKGEIAEAKLVNVRDLDLSDNVSLTSFEEVHYIAEQLPRLESLQLNRIPFAESSLKTTAPFNTLHRLILNYCNLSKFSALRELSAPHLHDLHLEGCGIPTLDMEGFDFSFPKCHAVNISFNGFNSWGVQSSSDPRLFGDILRHVFPTIATFKVNGCALPAFTHETPKEQLAFFGEISAFALCESDSWSTPSSLQILSAVASKLTWLSVSSTKIFHPLKEVQARLMVIATVPQIKTLNLGSVRPKELIDAEFFYVQRAYATEPDEAKRDLLFPRAKMLRERFADSIKVGSDAHGPMHVILPLTFRCLGFEDVQKSLPSNTTVEKLRLLISTFFKGVSPQKQTLHFTTQDEVTVSAPIPLDIDTQSLAYFGVGIGSRIIVTLPEELKK